MSESTMGRQADPRHQGDATDEPSPLVAAAADGDRPPAAPDLRILRTRVYRGPNYWSYEPAVHLLVDLG